MPAGFSSSLCSFPPFVPQSIPGCVLWLRADRGVIASAGLVNTWLDQSGNGNHVTQVTGSSQPTQTVNILPCLQFTAGSVQQLLNSTMSIPQPFEQIVVIQSTDGSLTYVIDHGTVNNKSAIYRSASTTMTLYPQSANVACSQNVIHVLDAQSNNSTGLLAIDNGSAVAGSVGNAVTVTGVSVGNRFDAPANAWGGCIYEVIIFNTLLSATNRTQVLSYINGRYSLGLGI
jgi:hypothetical protein